jgi:predicted aconitase
MNKMQLSTSEREMLQGKQGKATQKAMEILVVLGKIYGAERLIPVTSVQISGVSYDNLGEAGLQFLTEMGKNSGKARVLTTLNPAGMDLENWQILGISEEFVYNQKRVIDTFYQMEFITTCSCTPYLFGNIPHYGEHIAWAESSAVCYANSVLGARTNREGGPSALAASLTGLTPLYGYHLDENRCPTLTVKIAGDLSGTHEFGALGMVIGRQIEKRGKNDIPYIRGIKQASIENLKSFCASIATFGGTALFHIEGITPEAAIMTPPKESIHISKNDIQKAIDSLTDAESGATDFVSLGCPHLTIGEIARIAELLKGKKVRKEFWITTSRPIKHIADNMGYTQTIEESGAKFAVDTCCVVAPIKGRFKALATDSAKACFYAYAKNGFSTLFKSFDEVVLEATK